VPPNVGIIPILISAFEKEDFSAARAFSFSGRFSVRIETAPDPHARVGAGIAVQFFPSVLSLSLAVSFRI
jgi:hypothetical protein